MNYNPTDPLLFGETEVMWDTSNKVYLPLPYWKFYYVEMKIYAII